MFTLDKCFLTIQIENTTRVPVGDLYLTMSGFQNVSNERRRFSRSSKCSFAQDTWVVGSNPVVAPIKLFRSSAGVTKAVVCTILPVRRCTIYIYPLWLIEEVSP